MTLARSHFAPRILVIAVALLVFALAGSARAADFVVDDNSDPNPPVDCSATPDHCTLRGAITAMNAGSDTSNTITLTKSTYALNSANGQLSLQRSVVINGNGSTVDAGGNSRVFVVGGACRSVGVTMNDLTVTGGSVSGNGGGAQVINSQLTLERSAVTGNSAFNGGGVWVGSLTCVQSPQAAHFGFSDSLIVNHTELSDNHADNHDSGGLGGAVFITSGDSASLVNSTLSGNTAVDDGSAIYDSSSGRIDTRNVTIGANKVTSAFAGKCAPCAGAVSSDGEFNPTNTLLANNLVDTTPPSPPPSIHAATIEQQGNCFGGIGTSGDYNISDDLTCGLNGAHDQNGVDPKLGPLQNNGGPNKTMAIGRDSPAFDYVPTSNCSSTSDDQRGLPRPAFAQCDSGAFELQPSGADVSLTKSASPSSVTVGQNVTFTLTSSNAGPDPATNTVVTDTLPAGLAFVSDSASQGSCTGTTAITCNLGTVAAGAHATITIVARVTNAGQFTNSAGVTADPADPNSANNHATVTVTGVAPAAPGCTDTRRFTFKLHKFRKARITDVVVSINGKRAAHKKGHNLRSITISKLPQQVFTVKIVSTQNTGSKLISTRKYNGCVKSKPKTTAFHIKRHRHHH